MVAATIEVNVDDAVKVSIINMTRLPSDLNYLRADYWDTTEEGNDIRITEIAPYERFTLQDNPDGATSHFLSHRSVTFSVGSVHHGPGSGGYAFRRVGAMIMSGISNTIGSTFSGLALLDEGFESLNIEPSLVTRWAGQVGAAYLAGSVGYNGWTARASAPIEVFSTGGETGTCYKPPYAVGFLPLVLSALFVIIWSFLLLLRSSLLGSSRLRQAYEGLGPYCGVMCPGAPVKETLLLWEGAGADPHLQLVSEEHAVSDASGTALTFLEGGTHADNTSGK
jgi:hypothetical protein